MLWEDSKPVKLGTKKSEVALNKSVLALEKPFFPFEDQPDEKLDYLTWKQLPAIIPGYYHKPEPVPMVIR